MDDLWIIVRNWDKFQSYDDDPLWIKLWLKLGSKPEFRLLSCTHRGVLLTTWVEFARADGALSLSYLRLMFQDGYDRRYIVRSLKALENAGFVELSTAKPSRARARAREEKRREEQRAPARTREGAGARSQEQDRPQVNAPASPKGAAAYVRNVGRSDPNLERTLRETFGVPDDMLDELLNTAGSDT